MKTVTINNRKNRIINNIVNNRLKEIVKINAILSEVGKWANR